MRTTAVIVVLAVATIARAEAADLSYKAQMLDALVQRVPQILKSFNAETGRFGSGIWICRDQHPMYPLAVAYATPGDGNPYYQSAELLDVIVKAGDPLIENMDERGRWIFAKKDGSTWGMIWMPWTYSRWIRTFQLVRERMPAAKREAWTTALTLGYTGISQHALSSIHNIPTHHAMGLYIAGKTLDRPEWCRQATEFLRKVAAAQSEGGYWSEGGGPVVRYDFVYVDALGTYYGASGDEQVLPALKKAALFHRHFTYPGGQDVETIDQRNPYHDTIEEGNVGFTFSPVGRAYLADQWARLGTERLDPDLIASLLLYGEEGPVAEAPPGGSNEIFELREGGAVRAATLRRGPWFVCLSAYVTPVSSSRWIQDRQNFVSVYHDKTGLVLGGGNTKLQPAWSNFTVGDVSLLAHRPGDESPKFLPRGELYHVPSAATLSVDPQPGIDLTYGPETCRIRVRVIDDRNLELALESTTTSKLPLAAHLTLIPHLDKPLCTGNGKTVTLGTEPLALPPDELGGRLTHAGYRLDLPPTASLHWPALPHNPYRKDGRAAPEEGRIEIRIPFDAKHPQYRIGVEVLP